MGSAFVSVTEPEGMAELVNQDPAYPIIGSAVVGPAKVLGLIVRPFVPTHTCRGGLKEYLQAAPDYPALQLQSQIEGRQALDASGAMIAVGLPTFPVRVVCGDSPAPAGDAGKPPAVDAPHGAQSNPTTAASSRPFRRARSPSA